MSEPAAPSESSASPEPRCGHDQHAMTPEWGRVGILGHAGDLSAVEPCPPSASPGAAPTDALIEDLRRLADPHGATLQSRDKWHLGRAADEIERLRATVNRLAAPPVPDDREELVAQRRLRNEIDAYRDAAIVRSGAHPEAAPTDALINRAEAFFVECGWHDAGLGDLAAIFALVRSFASTPTAPKEALHQAIYDALVDHPYHCQEPCCTFSEAREEAFCTLVEDVVAAALASQRPSDNTGDDRG